MKVAQQLDEARRDVFKAAALKKKEDGTYESRVDKEAIKTAILAALESGDLTLRTFSTGSVGVQVSLRFGVQNDAGQEFDLRGNVMLTIPETVVKTK